MSYDASAATSSSPWARAFQLSVAHLMRTGNFTTPCRAASSPSWLASPRGLAVGLYLGLITVVGYLLVGWGFRTVPAPVAVTLGLAEPLVAALLGLLVLNERLTATATAGLILVGLALAVLAVPARSARAAAGAG